MKEIVMVLFGLLAFLLVFGCTISNQNMLNNPLTNQNTFSNFPSNNESSAFNVIFEECKATNEGTLAMSQCYVIQAAITGDISFCNQIQDKNETNNCFRAVALAKKDSSFCGNILDSSTKLQCQTSVQANTGKNLSILQVDCANFKVTQKSLDECHNLPLKESLACEDNLQQHDFCYLNQAIEKKDPSICDIIIAADAKAACKIVTSN
ncbi:MAG: hypothetical protein NTY48_03045 [Candidatus Diapherotrites archaeon]|nr:hypothetical protein [Candidatus Diapherotrites archaeon]